MVLAIDIGGTKLAISIFSKDGTRIHSARKLLDGKKGAAVGRLIIAEIHSLVEAQKKKNHPIEAIGVSVPGIVWSYKGTVWAPKIGGWENYPLAKEISDGFPDIPVVLESDRTCYILGERWRGCAVGCDNAIFLAIGTGIGAGIIANGVIIKGAHDIGGAVGWMAVPAPDILNGQGKDCSFETYASGSGIKRLAQELINRDAAYNGVLKAKQNALTASDIFEAYDTDQIARTIVEECIVIWAIAAANLISVFNPEKVILGGGVFGPAVRFIPEIKAAIKKWAQPVSESLYSLEASALGQDAGVFGAAYAALRFLNHNR